MNRSILLTTLLFLVAIVLSNPTFAQKKGKTSSTSSGAEQDKWREWQIQLQKDIFKEAAQYGDFHAARGALYHLIAIGADDAQYKDSLLGLYMNMGAYSNALMVGKTLLEEKPEDKMVINSLAVAHQGLGNYKEALEFYEKLYGMSKDIQHLYQISTLQYNMERFGECRTTIEKVMADPGAEQAKVSITYAQGKAQMVPIKAAAMNIKGVIALSTNQEDAAKEFFEKAVEVFPEFVLAKGNIKMLENMQGSRSNKKEGGDPAKPADKK